MYRIVINMPLRGNLNDENCVGEMGDFHDMEPDRILAKLRGKAICLRGRQLACMRLQDCVKNYESSVAISL
jgi:hypothetical protein